MKQFIPGKRIIKTVMALLICLLFFYSLEYYYPIHAAVACVLMMRATSDETKTVGINRVKGTLLGGLISFLALLFKENVNMSVTSFWFPILIGMAVLVSFTLCKGFNQDSYVASMSAVVILITLMNHAQSSAGIFSYVSIRILETLMGIMIAFVINRYFFRSFPDSF